MSHPPSERDREYDRTYEEDVNLDTENYDHDDYEESQSLRRRSDPNAPTRSHMRSETIRNQDMIKRRTGGILTNLNILHEDRERENLHSISKIKGDGVVRDEHFKSLKHPPKKIRLFKEWLVSGKFIQISKEVEPEIDETKLYPIDEEDILEYRLFNSIDIWARRVSIFFKFSFWSYCWYVCSSAPCCWCSFKHSKLYNWMVLFTNIYIFLKPRSYILGCR